MHQPNQATAMRDGLWDAAYEVIAEGDAGFVIEEIDYEYAREMYEKTERATTPIARKDMKEITVPYVGAFPWDRLYSDSCRAAIVISAVLVVYFLAGVAWTYARRKWLLYLWHGRARALMAAAKVELEKHQPSTALEIIEAQAKNEMILAEKDEVGVHHG